VSIILQSSSHNLRAAWFVASYASHDMGRGISATSAPAGWPDL
jgi:hypothetical protein